MDGRQRADVHTGILIKFSENLKKTLRGNPILRIAPNQGEVQHLIRQPRTRREAKATARDIVKFVVVPLALLVGSTLCLRVFDLDRACCRCFYSAEQRVFPGSTSETCLTLYKYAPIPGLLLGVGGAILAALSFVTPWLRSFREPCLFFAVLLALGPGLFVNGLLKGCLDRPRPRELAEFGGCEQFVEVLDLRRYGDCEFNSFPSGHASMGFYIIAPAFFLYRRNAKWAIIFVLLGLSAGFVIGLGRMAQGSHFPTDVIWSCAMVYFPGLAMRYTTLRLERYRRLRLVRATRAEPHRPTIPIREYLQSQSIRSGGSDADSLVA
jgi:membrane-associated PAP2 superfamily phosphatase